MRGNRDSHPVLVKVDCQNSVIESLFPVQDRSDLGGFAQISHHGDVHSEERNESNRNVECNRDNDSQ